MRHVYLILSICTILQLGSQTASECLIAAYNFNQQTVNDDIGTCHGTAVGATLVTDRFGNPNGAWYLAGNPQSYLNLGTYATLKPASGSISLWFNIDNPVFTGSGYVYNPLIHTKGQQGNNCYETYAVYYNPLNQRILGFTTDFPCTQPVTYSSPVTAKAWHNVVYTYDANKIKLYVDGIKVDSAATGFSPVFLSSDSVMVGTSANVQNDKQFNGAIDDIRFYRCVIDQKQVTDLYLESNPVHTELASVPGERVKISMNYRENELLIDRPANDPYFVKVTDVLGRVLLQEQCTEQARSFKLAGIPKGVYTVQVIDRSRILVKKIVAGE